MPISRPLLGLALALAAASCARTDGMSEPATSSADGAPEGEVGTDAGIEDQTLGAAIVGKELPAELVAELRLRGDDSDGRLLTLAPGFIATAACADCGAPSYLWFLAVRCTDDRHCDVLTEQCEGTISRDADSTYELAFHPIEDEGEGESAGEAEGVCADYTGTFEAP